MPEARHPAEQAAGAVKDETPQVGKVLREAARPQWRLLSANSTRQVASIVIDTGEEIGNRVLEIQERVAEMTRGTPFAPVLRIQASIGRRIVEGSARLARSIWQVGSGHQT
ncbi:MAG TPA: hypothetical protein VIX12_01140 [Candidatus Binataceae bacterium]